MGARTIEPEARKTEVKKAKAGKNKAGKNKAGKNKADKNQADKKKTYKQQSKKPRRTMGYMVDGTVDGRESQPIVRSITSAQKSYNDRIRAAQEEMRSN